MFINYNDIFERKQKAEQINIIASKGYAYMVKEVYDKIIEHDESSNIFILTSDDIICPLKNNKGDLYIILGVSCPEHHFENAVYLQEDLSDEDLDRIKKYQNIIFDSMHERYNRNKEIQLNKEIVVVSKNTDFFKYFSRIYDCVSFYGLVSENKMEFLTRRINISQIAKNNKTFAIIFVHEIFKDLALKIRDTLIKSSRYAYTLFLRNVRYSRLITIEKIDTLVLIDCPVFDNYKIDVTLPILSPADVQYILTQKWDSNYNTNNFNVVLENTEDKDICKYEGAGKLILDSEFFGIEYGNPDKNDYEIHEGKKGVASEYEHEE
ncbi:hypothetical protein P3W45_001258 [Vairimorpha bombi]|jgi:diphthamide synthase subunit DPH2